MRVPVAEFPVLLFIFLCRCPTGRSDLGVPAWLGQHQRPQRPARGPADVPVRYTDISGGLLDVALQTARHYHTFTLSKAINKPSDKLRPPLILCNKDSSGLQSIVAAS